MTGRAVRFLPSQYGRTGELALKRGLRRLKAELWMAIEGPSELKATGNSCPKGQTQTAWNVTRSDYHLGLVQSGILHHI